MEYFDELFEASYHQSLSDVQKSTLKEKTEKSIKGIFCGIDTSLPAKELIAKLEDRGSLYLVYEDPSLFSRDFPLMGKVNCVSYADFIVSALDMMGRGDVAVDIRVKYDSEHLWLCYEKGSENFEIDTANHRSDKSHTLRSLVAANLVNKGIMLAEMKNYDEAVAVALEASKLDNDMEKARILLENVRILRRRM